jgi:hypothetical protein
LAERVARVLLLLVTASPHHPSTARVRCKRLKLLHLLEVSSLFSTSHSLIRTTERMDQSISIAREALSNPPAELQDVLSAAPDLVQQAQSTLDSQPAPATNGDANERQDNASGKGLEAKLQVGESSRFCLLREMRKGRWGRAGTSREAATGRAGRRCRVEKSSEGKRRNGATRVSCPAFLSSPSSPSADLPMDHQTILPPFLRDCTDACYLPLRSR